MDDTDRNPYTKGNKHKRIFAINDTLSLTYNIKTEIRYTSQNLRQTIMSVEYKNTNFRRFETIVRNFCNSFVILIKPLFKLEAVDTIELNIFIYLEQELCFIKSSKYSFTLLSQCFGEILSF